MSLLKVTDLKVSYGGIEALKGVSFAVKEGEIVTLIGANGAGKSTALRSISGLVSVKGGTIEFCRRGHHRHGPAEDRLQGHRHGAGGAAGVPQPHRGGKPQDRRLFAQGRGRYPQGYGSCL